VTDAEGLMLGGSDGERASHPVAGRLRDLESEEGVEPGGRLNESFVVFSHDLSVPAR
jgi:hypothetical protein